MTYKFKVGDRVRIVRDNYGCREEVHGKPEGTIARLSDFDGGLYVVREGDTMPRFQWFHYAHELELLEEALF